MKKLLEIMKSIIEQLEIIVTRHRKNRYGIGIFQRIRYYIKSNIKSALRVLLEALVFAGFFSGMKFYVKMDSPYMIIPLIISGFCLFILIDITTGQI